jgi:HemY protein
MAEHRGDAPAAAEAWKQAAQAVVVLPADPSRS